MGRLVRPSRRQMASSAHPVQRARGISSISRDAREFFGLSSEGNDYSRTKKASFEKILPLKLPLKFPLMNFRHGEFCGSLFRVGSSRKDWDARAIDRTIRVYCSLF